MRLLIDCMYYMMQMIILMKKKWQSAPGTTRCRCLVLQAIASPTSMGSRSQLSILDHYMVGAGEMNDRPFEHGCETCKLRKHQQCGSFRPLKTIIMRLSAHKIRGAAFESSLNSSTKPCNQSYLFNSGVFWQVLFEVGAIMTCLTLVTG